MCAGASPCTRPATGQYGVLVRANRRGEITGPNGTYHDPSGGPGDTNGAKFWGPAYSTSLTSASVMSLPYTYYTPLSLPSASQPPNGPIFHNGTGTGYINHTGTPDPNTLIQVYDPTSTYF